jgi:hypothetical protein
MKFLYHPDTVLTASDLEKLALSLLVEIPIPGVEAQPSTPESSGRHFCKLLSIRSNITSPENPFGHRSGIKL